ncbi:cAMP-specific 3',5'-cyclic phosphodiesterase 4C-like isoform X2 [Xenia sp. Carnegie-2017]|uniref:cAMP-specific 3',5'-cyclic phosphodiesterase 4C-like isoform X2 n=1 Tax=Xenia sp. Carnegie-2017 TaxID=2897299 RepID=UPI001F04EDCF|nr:cAMP-specific 3',5'-cyclic phosphodiesterase 4C-like isoform X2 [Xenia sp. Carnegie-2017]
MVIYLNSLDMGSWPSKNTTSCFATKNDKPNRKSLKSSQESSSERAECEKLTVPSGYVPQRRESFIYKSDSEGEISPRCMSPRHASLSDGTRFEELVTPFAQIISSLRIIRNNFMTVSQAKKIESSFKQTLGRRSSYEVNGVSSGHSSHQGECQNRLVKDTLDELDWVLNQLETLETHCSVSELASNKFKRLLNRELKDFSEATQSKELSMWVYNTFVDKHTSIDSSSGIRARSKSLVASIGKLKRISSFSGTIPRFGVEVKDETELAKHLDCVHKWDFDVFKLHDITNGRPLAAVTYTILQARDLMRIFKIKPSTFINYITLIEDHYMKHVPFHNSTHSADVVQSAHVLLSAEVFESVFSDLEILATLFAAAVHDVDHPGLSNHFLVATNSPLALLYNDESVLENHHLHVAFELLQQHGCDIFENMSRKERQSLRKNAIEMVLATDNAKHMSLLASLKTMVETKKLSASKFSLDNYADRIQVLRCLVHCADLSNPTKHLPLYKEWVDRLMEEFFRQGDRERKIEGMDVSPMMDRYNASVEKSQVVFIDFVAQPLWETWAELTYPDAQGILDTLEENRDWYNSQICDGKQEPHKSLSSDSDKPAVDEIPFRNHERIQEKRVSWQEHRNVAIDLSNSKDEAKTSTPYMSAVEQARLQSTKSSSRSREADDELDSDDAGTEDDEELKALNKQGDHRL